jgi:hypothetical protein
MRELKLYYGLRIWDWLFVATYALAAALALTQLWNTQRALGRAVDAVRASNCEVDIRRGAPLHERCSAPAVRAIIESDARTRSHE